MKKVDVFKLLSLIIIPLCSIFCVWYATRFGIGLTPDSTFYISAAESFIQQGEIRSIYEGSQMEYLTHYPPGYSMVLAGINLFVHDLYESARWVNVLCLFALLFSTGFALRNKLKTVFVLVIQLLVLISLSIFKIYEMAWSEPLFLLLSFVALYALYRFTQAASDKWKWLILAASLIALATMARYIGVTLILSTLFITWSTTKSETIIQRLKYVFVQGAIASSLLILWMIRNFLRVSKPTDRHFEFHPMSEAYYREWFITTTDFFQIPVLSEPVKFALGIGLFVLILAFAMSIFLKRKASLQSIWLTYAFTYILFLLFSNTFLDYTPLYFRTLSPAYLFIVLAMLLSFGSSTKIKFIFRMTLLVGITLFQLKLFRYYLLTITDARDLASRNFNLPETIAAIEKIPDDVKIYSNGVDRLYVMTRGRKADWSYDWKNTENGIYYDVLFKHPESYPYPEYLDRSSGVAAEIIYDSEDVLIQKRMP